MNPLSTVLLALAMSTDAFAAAVGKGAALHRPRWSEALRTGLIFGVIEALTPLVGWALGQAAESYVKQWDHWIAFALLGGLGLHMAIEGFGEPDAPDDDAAAAVKSRHGFWTLALTGFGTSIDAMAVGVSLAFIDVPIVPIAVTIGVATFAMVTTGVMVGRLLGAVLGKRAEIAGGLVLIGVGVAILVEHLSGAG